MKLIKLYSKTVLEFRVNNNAEIIKVLEDIREKDIPLKEIQNVEIITSLTKRKYKPYNVTIKYYELKTIMEMINDLEL